MSLQNGGSVSADSGGTLGGQQFSGSGLAGNINIAAGDQIADDWRQRLHAGNHV